jgi:hypothetical protein
VLNIGGLTRYATYFSASSTAIKFRLILDAADVLLDLDGISVNTAVDMNAGSSIRDVATNDFTAAFPFSEKDYVYFTNTMARYHILDSDYNTAACAAGSCITSVTDITGNGYTLTPTTSPGPAQLSGFGTNSTNYMQFNNVTSLKFPNIAPNPLTAFSAFNIKYAIFVMKNVPDASTTPTLSSHLLLNRFDQTGTSYHWGGPPYGAHSHGDSIQYTSGYHPYYTYAWMSLIKFTSDDNDKSILMYPTQKIKIDAAAMTLNYTSSETGPTLWTPGANNIFIHEFSSQLSAWPGTAIGGATFKGQIAEMIFITGGTNITETNLNRIRDQLNAIHGAY